MSTALTAWASTKGDPTEIEQLVVFFNAVEKNGGPRSMWERLVEVLFIANAHNNLNRSCTPPPGDSCPC